MTATVSTHVLNGADGTHAGSVGVTLARTQPAGGRTPLFAAETDDGGRLIQQVDLNGADPAALYELVFATGDYWAGRPPTGDRLRLVAEVVIRFTMPEPEERYHMPIIISPNSYAFWCSSCDVGAG